MIAVSVAKGPEPAGGGRWWWGDGNWAAMGGAGGDYLVSYFIYDGFSYRYWRGVSEGVWVSMPGSSSMSLAAWRASTTMPAALAACRQGWQPTRTWSGTRPYSVCNVERAIVLFGVARGAGGPAGAGDAMAESLEAGLALVGTDGQSSSVQLLESELVMSRGWRWVPLP